MSKKKVSVHLWMPDGKEVCCGKPEFDRFQHGNRETWCFEVATCRSCRTKAKANPQLYNAIAEQRQPPLPELTPLRHCPACGHKL